MLLPLLKDHLRVECALPPEGDPVRRDAEGGGGALQAGELTFQIAQGETLSLLLPEDALGDQLHHVFLPGLQALYPSD